MGKGCIVIGAAMLDIVMEIDQIPKSGTDVYAKGQSMMVGGCAYNVADILKHFGVNYTLFAPIGTGMYADFIRKELKKAGHESQGGCEANGKDPDQWCGKRQERSPFGAGGGGR